MSRNIDGVFDSLATRLRGRLLRAADPGYDEARRVWNAMIDRKPAAIAQCSGASDIRDCIRFAREADVPFSIRGGGHNIAGTAVCDGGLMIDQSGRRGVHVDMERRRVRVEPGATLGDLDRETLAHGLVVPAGIVSTTGVAGLALAGGFGWLSRKWGYTCDHLISADVVTAEGDFIRASAEEHPDLFWALKGGGGNFGVVTSFEFAARPLAPAVTAGMAIHFLENGYELLALYRELAASAPEELSLLLVLRKAPPAPFIPEDMHGRPIAAIAVCYPKTGDAAERAVGPIRRCGPPVVDSIRTKPFQVHQTMLDAAQPKGRHYYWKSDYVADFARGTDDVLLDAAENLTSPHSSILVMQLGGAIARIDSHGSAVGHRNAGHVVNIAASWESSKEPPERHVGWAREAFDRLQPFSMGGGYVNFLTADELADGGGRVRAAFAPETYERLRRLKRTWDPDNLFRHNQNIVPAETATVAPAPGMC